MNSPALPVMSPKVHPLHSSVSIVPVIPASDMLDRPDVVKNRTFCTLDPKLVPTITCTLLILSVPVR